LGSAGEVDRFFAAWPAWLGDEGADWLAGDATVPGLRQALQRSPVDALDVLSRENGDATVPASGLDCRIGRAWQAYEAALAPPGGLRAQPRRRFAVPVPDGTESGTPALPSSLAVQWH
ncbi:MAG: hypothetical protein JNM26_18485, partial [Ideonella sp.]|nr:hypothetical protein [Ideonella sp.]